MSPLNSAFALKVLSIVIGAVAFGLTLHAYDETNLEEEYFLRSVQAFLFISAAYLPMSFIVVEKILEYIKAIDIVLHISGAIILLIVSGLLIFSAVDNERVYCDILHISFPEHFCQFYREKLAAGVITIMNGLLYALIAVLIFISHVTKRRRTRKEKYNNFYRTAFQQYQFQQQQQQQRPKSFYFGAK